MNTGMCGSIPPPSPPPPLGTCAFLPSADHVKRLIAACKKARISTNVALEWLIAVLDAASTIKEDD